MESEMTNFGEKKFIIKNNKIALFYAPELVI